MMTQTFQLFYHLAFFRCPLIHLTFRRFWTENFPAIVCPVSKVSKSLLANKEIELTMTLSPNLQPSLDWYDERNENTVSLYI